jgi:hypothetical protein
VFIHFVRVPFLFIAHRPPQNYLHAAIGLTILAMAGYQVRRLSSVVTAAEGPVSFGDHGNRSTMGSTSNGPS